MAEATLSDLSVFKGIVQIIERCRVDRVPLKMDKAGLFIELFNTDRHVFVSIQLLAGSFERFQCKAPIHFYLNSYYLCHFVLKVCEASRPFSISIKNDRVYLSCAKLSGELVSSTKIQIITEPPEYQISPTPTHTVLSFLAGDIINAINIVNNLEQETFSFVVKKTSKGSKLEIVGSNSGAFTNSIHYWGTEGVESKKKLKETFGTSLLHTFICVNPPSENLTVSLDGVNPGVLNSKTTFQVLNYTWPNSTLSDFIQHNVVY
ncbi:Proliferating cell nuclear antigen [Entamoeba marina]